VSFRLSSVNICRAGIVGFACLAFAGASRAGEGARNIEVVPLHGTPMDTNFDQSSSADSQTFKAWSPQAPHSTQAPTGPGEAMIPLPRPQITISPERQRELFDRRRNWVFMTAEEYASPGGKKDGLEENGLDKKSTAMERYYQGLYDSDHSAMTNQFNKLNSDRFGGATNSLGGEQRNPDGGVFADSPFNTTADPGIFQTVRRGDSSNPFDSDTSSALPTPEAVRLQAEQKAHMDAFRQLMNIDQPSVAPVSSPASASVDSGPLFGLSSPGIQSGNSVGSLDIGSSSTHSQTAPAVSSPRNTRPPHATFAPPQRPF
jgi:hypothetical protein